MPVQHVDCGGIIDTKKRQCTRCKHKWGLLDFWFNTGEIRPIIESKTVRAEAIRRKTYEPKKHAKWAEKVPGATVLPKYLPNWPRWARILSTLVFLAVVVGVILWIWVF